MPHLVFCAASAPLHELPLCEMDPHHAQHDQNFHRHHHTHSKCTNVAVQDRDQSNSTRSWEVVHMFQTAYNGFVHPQTVRSNDSIPSHCSSSSTSELRSDLVAIPRVGFPPNQTTLCHHQPICTQSNVAVTGNSMMQTYLPMPNMVTQISPVFDHVGEGGSRAFIFTRIEAIYI